MSDRAPGLMAAVSAETDGELLFGQVVGVQPGMTTTAPEVVQGVLTEQPGANAGTRGSIESLGRWNEKHNDRAMPVKLIGDVRLAFSKLVDELVQNGASSGILAIIGRRPGPPRSVVSWSASPDDKSYQRHGTRRTPDEAARLRAEAKKGKEPLKIRFADFEGVVYDMGDKDEMAVYRVTLPSRGLDPDKWAGRPPPLARADLYTGTRRDWLLSTEEISGDYFCCFIPICNLMTVVPHGPDMIETWSTCCVFPLGLMANPDAGVRTRKPGTNEFSGGRGAPMTFSADGTAKQGCGNFKKRPDSQKRAFQKVETRDLAGKWWSCFCFPFLPFWPLTPVYRTRKTALNEDQYEESSRYFVLGVPCTVDSFESRTRTRVYVNGHPTNGFAKDDGGDPHWYRDPGCAAQLPCYLAKKAG